MAMEMDDATMDNIHHHCSPAKPTSSGSGSAKMAMYENIRYRNHTGTLLLTPTRVLFQGGDNNHPKKIKWSWRSIQKIQTNKRKLMIKFVSKTHEGKSVTFGLDNVANLEKMRQDVKKRLKQSRAQPTLVRGDVGKAADGKENAGEQREEEYEGTFMPGMDESGTYHLGESAGFLTLNLEDGSSEVLDYEPKLETQYEGDQEAEDNAPVTTDDNDNLDVEEAAEEQCPEIETDADAEEAESNVDPEEEEVATIEEEAMAESFDDEQLGEEDVETMTEEAVSAALTSVVAPEEVEKELESDTEEVAFALAEEEITEPLMEVGQESKNEPEEAVSLALTTVVAPEEVETELESDAEEVASALAEEEITEPLMEVGQESEPEIEAVVASTRNEDQVMETKSDEEDAANEKEVTFAPIVYADQVIETDEEGDTTTNETEEEVAIVPIVHAVQVAGEEEDAPHGDETADVVSELDHHGDQDGGESDEEEASSIDMQTAVAEPEDPLSESKNDEDTASLSSEDFTNVTMEDVLHASKAVGRDLGGEEKGKAASLVLDVINVRRELRRTASRKMKPTRMLSMRATKLENDLLESCKEDSDIQLTVRKLIEYFEGGIAKSHNQDIHRDSIRRGGVSRSQERSKSKKASIEQPITTRRKQTKGKKSMYEFNGIMVHVS